MTIVSQPSASHRCGPSRYGVWLGYTHDRAGTVRACDECGKTWVAYRQKYTHGMRGQLHVGSLWRPEGWFARWRRARKSREA
jgi:hypothetical protein